MRIIKVELDKLDKNVLNIGWEGEQNHVQVQIQCGAFFAKYPNAGAVLTVLSPANVTYPVVLDKEGNDLIWDIDASDVVNAGSGKIQLTFTDGSGDDAEVIKTVIGSFNVNASLAVDGEAPDPIQTWINEANEILEEFGEVADLSASATTLPAGSSATAQITTVSGHKNIAIGVPKGDKGDQGDPAPAEDVADAVDAYVSTNWSSWSGALDRTLTSNQSAAPADMVGDLKSAVKQKADSANSTRKYPSKTSIDVTDTTWTNTVYDNGSFVSHANYLLSDYIPLNIANAGYAKVETTGGIYCGAYIFDGSKNFLSSKAVVANGGTIDLNNVKDGYYCRVLLRYNPASPISPSVMDYNSVVIHVDYDPDINTLISVMNDDVFINRYAGRENKLPIDGTWYIGQVNSSDAMQTSSNRITTKIIPFPYNHFKIDFVDSTYSVYAKFYDKNMTKVEHTTSNDYITSDLEINRTQRDIKYAVFNVKLANNGAFVPSDAKNITVKVIDLDSISVTNLTVCTYNVGEYQNGTGNDDIAHPELVVPAYRQFYAKQNFDIIGLQEAHTNGWGDTYGPSADNALYNYLYPYKVENTNLTALLCKYPFKESGSGWIQESDTDHRRRYAYAVINIGGNDVWLYCVHLNPTAEYRALHITELISILATKERFICFGDFNFGNDNENAQTEINSFINAGFKAANGSYLGLIATAGLGQGETRKYLDNIITSANINIFNVEAIGNISDLYSDHLPLKVELTVY